MSAREQGGPISTMLVDESFATQDDQFVQRVREATSPKYLAALADRWKKDHRPWARQQIFAYLALPLDRPGHHPLVKRLFKQAEAERNDELMAAFLVAFDRLIRRQRRVRYQYDFQTRQSWQEEELFAPRDQILAGTVKGRDARNPRTGERIFAQASPRIPKNGRLFSYRTRQYLRRRAWRYFRRMGFQRATEYPQAIAAALVMYRDEDVARGENILDNRSLVHAAFGHSPVLRFARSKVELAEGRTLGELAAAPRFAHLWKKPESATVLLNVLTQANSRLVQVWAIQLLKQEHAQALQAITADRLLALLDHSDQEVQQFAAGLLETLQGIDSWPISTWLKLLEAKNVTVLATICQAMTQRVRPERLTLAQCVTLACTRATPVARLGLTWLAARAISNDEDRSAIARLADAECEAIGVEAATHALSILGAAAAYRTEGVIPFFDSFNSQVRRGALEWLTPESAGYNDPALWSRLLETPYDDVRLRLVGELDKRSAHRNGPAALSQKDASPIWTTVLLGVHRGGRAKLKALRQISQAIADQPDRAEDLVPVLAVAIRSVRPAEARAGLAAILSAVSRCPELEAVLGCAIPELRLAPAEAAR